ncbi:MAG TPA: protein-L-isoaspartate O-methyltransferase, partial [Candidatus Nanoarchaeia archaeon]|nr:protein-L-isoaspartate O-methyltransferase [Candidatus Nanoarchaeia archaeon]
MSKELLIDHWRSTGIITDKRVLKAFSEIPREQFVPPELKIMAYDDVPLPIGEDQTISQPSTVMLMLQALELKSSDVV